MPTPFAAGRSWIAALALGLMIPGASAGPADSRPPSPREIAADLGRIRAYLDSALVPRVIDRRTGRVISGRGDLPAEAAVAGDRLDAKLDADSPSPPYEMGVIYSGMLSASEATGDRSFDAFTARRLQFLADHLPAFQAQAARFGMARNSYQPVFAPTKLDNCGAMEAALIQARRDGVGPDLLPVIRHWSDYIAHGQFRLADGTLARRTPQPESVWADDLYMAVPALVEMYRLTGDRAWLDDAARDALQTAHRLFRPQTGLYAHGWASDAPEAPEFYWGRANGWAMIAFCDLLDALPENHPARAEALRILRAQIHGVAELQSGSGLWHQLLDRNDSYLETSASAMFVFGIAHAIDRGWISAAGYGPVAEAGWIGVAGQINARGQVQNTCVGTTFAEDPVYYYRRPVSVSAMHGYGAVLLAGAEMIRLLRNPAVDSRTIYQARIFLSAPSAPP